MNNNETKPTAAAEVTPEMIDAWKKAHSKGVFRLDVGGKAGFFRGANRHDLKYAMTRMQAGGPLDMVEAIMDETWLGGD
ncbi:hypothetical protein [Rufibacter sp. LB8]|uniref:hypothetical protein n=1 Tax=Rufibacter sp. LB8 TaxID=2777781 RepID=UPI00178C72BC|nr:hypothetical protein [Rufibacter sp. LB8]